MLNPERFLLKVTGPVVAVAETVMQLFHPVPALAESVFVEGRTIELPGSAHKYYISHVKEECLPLEKISRDCLEYSTTMIRNRGLIAVVNERTGEVIYIEKPHKIVPSVGAFDFLVELDSAGDTD